MAAETDKVMEPDLTLISEFDKWSKAEGVGRSLKKRGFDMGTVKVVGADWLRSADASGYRTPAAAATLGLKIGVAISLLVGVIVGLLHSSFVPLGERMFAFLWPIPAVVVPGAIVGWMLGSLFGSIGESSEAPAWAETEYGNKLRSGAYLLIVVGDRSLLQRAQDAIALAQPTSLRIRPTKD